MPRILLLVLALVPFACEHAGDAPDTPGIEDTHLRTCTLPIDCDDGDPCTLNQCIGGRCQNPQRSCDDGNPCTENRCSGGDCIYPAIEGCCLDAGECDDDNPCTEDLCQDAACEHDLVPGCCVRNADCDDGDACTRNVCTEAHVCDFSTKDPAVGCCKAATATADCHDSDVCTVDTCVEERCVHTRREGCCHVDDECATDDPCLEARCLPTLECAYTPVADCCNEDADCADVPCTAATCVENACARTPVAGCCTGNADCGDACHECDIPDGGDRGTCVLKGTPGCCSATLLDAPFADLSGFGVAPLSGAGYAATPTWTLDGLHSASAPSSLYFGDPATHRIHPAGDGLVGGRATRTGLDLGTTRSPVLSFQVWRSGSIVSSVDVLSVIVVDGGSETTVWSTVEHPVDDGAFHPVSVSLASHEGRVVSLIFEFDSRSSFATDYQGVWVDDVKVTGQCQ